MQKGIVISEEIYYKMLESYDKAMKELEELRQKEAMETATAAEAKALLSALAGAERIFECMDEAPETDEGFVPLVPVVRDSEGRMTPAPQGAHVHDWAWKVPENPRFVLVCASKDAHDELVECGEAVPGHL